MFVAVEEDDGLRSGAGVVRRAVAVAVGAAKLGTRGLELVVEVEAGRDRAAAARLEVMVDGARDEAFFLLSSSAAARAKSKVDVPSAARARAISSSPALVAAACSRARRVSRLSPVGLEKWPNQPFVRFAPCSIE